MKADPKLAQHACRTIALFACVAALQAGAAESRLAIVSVDGRAAAASELLTAEFSRAEYGVAILERSEIDRIRREQNLTARSSADFARLGQELGAQGVLVLDVFEQKDATNLTVKLIAVQPGAALGFQSYPFPLKEMKEWPGLVGKQFAGLLPKLGVLAQDAIPISVLNLRSPLKTSEGVRLENDATTLLINRLIAQREIFVLERQRMTLLGAEKELKDMQESPFWNGSYLLEGVIERGGATRDALAINTRLVAPGRASQTVSVKSESGDLGALIEQLTRELISRLAKTTNLASWNPVAEANRYLQEARWGMRWGNIPLAQAAADSAWALGEHSLETALLRVNSYAAMAPPFHMPTATLNGEHVGPTDPPPAGNFDSLLTAFENFLTLTPALGTNAEAQDWTNVGQGLLTAGASRLCHYWYFPQRAASVAKELETMRVGAREIERILLHGNSRPDARTFATGAGTNVWQTKISFGWVYVESPEEAVAEFKRLIESGLTRQQREQFVGSAHRWMMPWTDSERARAPVVWTEFLAGMSRSTNAAHVLTARLMDIRTLPPGDEAARPELARRQQRAAEVMLKHRHDLLCHEPELVRQAIGLLDFVQVIDYRRRPPAADAVRTNYLEGIVTVGECFDERLLTMLFQVAAFQTNHLNQLLARIAQGSGTNSPEMWRKRFLQIYLAGTNPFRDEVFQQLFRAEDYTAAEAQRMLSRLTDWRDLERINHPQNLPLLDQRMKVVSSIITPVAPVPATPPPVLANSSVTNELVVTNFWRPSFTQVLDRSPTQFVTGYWLVQTLPHDDFIWAHVRAEYEYRWPAENPGWYYRSNQVFEQFFRINASDFSSVVSPIVPGPPIPLLTGSPWTKPTPLAVVDGVLYRHEQDKLFAWNPRETTWRTIDVTLPGQSGMQELDGRLYFSSSETLLEFNPATSTLRIMASHRRNPPVVAEDRLPFREPRLFMRGASNVVLVVLGGRIHPWNSAQGMWSEAFGGGPGMNDNAWLSARQDSVLYYQRQDHTEYRWRRFAADGSDELLFERKGQNNPSPMFRPKTPSVAPHWKLPDKLDVWPVSTARDGTNVWGLDWQKRSLTHFNYQADEGRTLELDITPKEITNAFPGLPQKVLLAATRDGLVITPAMSSGFWLLRQGDLDRALAKLPPVRRTERLVTALPSRAMLPAATNSGFSWADEAKSDAAKIVRTYESSKPGALNMGELASAIKREPALAPYRSLMKNFQTTLLLIEPYDTNGNQRIDVPELDAMIKAGKPRVTREEFMRRWDANGNDQFDPEEIRAAIAEKTARFRTPRRTNDISPNR